MSMERSMQMQPVHGDMSQNGHQDGHLYTQTNELRNAVVHYRRAANGTITEVDRVSTGGSGSGVFKPISGQESAPNAFEGAGSVLLTPFGALFRGLLAASGGTPARRRGDRGQTIRRPQGRPPTATKGSHMSLSDTVLTGPGGGRTVTAGHGSTAELKLAGEQSGGDWAVVEWRVRAGDEPPIHTHTREDETLYVLDGAITAFVGDQRIDVEAGSYAALPKDVPHGLRVRGGEARLLVTLEPAGAEYFLVPRDENDADPGRFGIVLNGAAPAA